MTRTSTSFLPPQFAVTKAATDVAHARDKRDDRETAKEREMWGVQQLTERIRVGQQRLQEAEDNNDVLKQADENEAKEAGKAFSCLSLPSWFMLIAADC